METSRRSMNSLAKELLQEAQARASSQKGMERFIHALLAGLPAPERDFLVRLQAYIATKRRRHRYLRAYERYLYRYDEQWSNRMGYTTDAEVRHARREYRELEQELVDEVGRRRVKELKRRQGMLWGMHNPATPR